MKVAVVCSFDLDGGAARAAYRLHQALQVHGADSRMFVQVRTSADPTVEGRSGGVAKLIGRIRPLIDHAPAKWMGTRLGQFSVNWLPGDLLARLASFNPDVVHLHWINAGFVSLTQIQRIGRPLLWTAHDMWPFTGGCHYDEGCERYATAGCTPCPMHTRGSSLNMAGRRLTSKRATLDTTQLTLISPSRWLASVGRRSATAANREILVIPNGLDLSRFKPIDKATARSLFGLPTDKFILLFGAIKSDANPRKGFAQVEEMLRRAAGSLLADSLLLCVYGTDTKSVGTLHGVPARNLGHLHDDEALVALYSAADLFLAPSLQDNLPNTVVEASACGLPSIAFNIGGMPDLIDDGVTGILAKEINGQALLLALQQAMYQPGWLAQAAIAARRLAEQRFCSRLFAARHMEAYAHAIRHSKLPCAIGKAVDHSTSAGHP